MVKIVKGKTSEEAINAVVNYVKNGVALPENIEYSEEINRFVQAFELAKASKSGIINDVTSTISNAATSVSGFLKNVGNAVSNAHAPSVEDEDRFAKIESRLATLERVAGVATPK